MGRRVDKTKGRQHKGFLETPARGRRWAMRYEKAYRAVLLLVIDAILIERSPNENGFLVGVAERVACVCVCVFSVCLVQVELIVPKVSLFAGCGVRIFAKTSSKTGGRTFCVGQYFC